MLRNITLIRLHVAIIRSTSSKYHEILYFIKGKGILNQFSIIYFKNQAEEEEEGENVNGEAQQTTDQECGPRGTIWYDKNLQGKNDH